MENVSYEMFSIFPWLPPPWRFLLNWTPLFFITDIRNINIGIIKNNLEPKLTFTQVQGQAQGHISTRIPA